ncbi:uncharacterized protein LOC112574549 [Pomacea canaliculata]|uniref:uncharacterized protein LOC112574549 n=1 Tax=Pomacea canaliculata TaxID=400727 RepID=UPI000D725863|nr:uncharacterized protein LOC112574549 [Pomacea canaliculata]
MVVCGIKGCGNKPCSKRNVPLDVSFHRIPKIILNQGDETRILTEERRIVCGRLYRKDITTEEKWNKILICSKHFVGGKPAYVNFRNSPSWLPTLHLGHERSSTCSEAETSKNSKPDLAQHST